MEKEKTQVDLEDKLFSMMWGHYVSASLRAATELKIADHLKNETRTAEEMAPEIKCHAQSLYRLMRALSDVGIFKREDKSFSLTPLGQLLRTDINQSQHGLVMEMCDYFDAWSTLADVVRTGKPVIDNSYDVMLSDTDRAIDLYDAMDSFHQDQPAPILGHYDFSEIKTITDIGGGSGSQLIAILQANPHLNGILFDLPETAQRSQKNIDKAGLSERCQVVGGSFFEEIPKGADLYLLRHVIHNWNDKDSVKILKNVSQVLPEHGRVVVIETLIDSDREEEAFAPWWDLAMFVVDDGAERSQEEYAELFAQVGLSYNRAIPTNVDVTLVEAIKQN